MKMSYSLAAKYSKIFEIMQDPYSLVILDYLFENNDYKTVEELVEVSKSTKGKVIQICDELRTLSILDREFVDSEPTYKALDSRYGNFVEKIIEIID
jgi:hypothetical protein